MRKRLLAAAATCSILFTATGASAATLLTQVTPTGPITSPGSYSINFASSGGAGTADFDLVGYLSLDGGAGSCCTDVFTLSLNGVDIFSGAFALGGSGANEIYLQPLGTNVVLTQTGFTFAGGQVDLTIPLMLLAGNNNLTFSYSGAFQGLGDEAFGIANLTVTGNAFQGNAVPEPGTWAMMLMGFGAIGAAMRRRRSDPRLQAA